MKRVAFRLNAGYLGLGPVLAALLFAFTLTVIFWRSAHPHEHYPDPVVGSITWDNIDKSKDVYALFLLVGSAIVLAPLISFACHQVAPLGRESDLGGNLNQLLLFSMIPAAWRLAAACLNASDKLPPIRFLCLFPIGAIFAILMLRRYRDALQPQDVFTIGGAMLLAPVMAGFSALGIVLSIARLIPGTVLRLAPYVNVCIYTVIIAAVVSSACIFVFSPDLDKFRSRLLRCLQWCQYPLVLLIFHLVQPPLVDLSHQFHNSYPRALVITLSVIALLSAWLMHRRFKSTTLEPNRPLIRSVSPASVAMLGIFIMVPMVSYPEIFADYFHTGEMLVPWQQIWDFHAVPYVEFAPVHGFMETLRGALDQLFFDGSMANYFPAFLLVTGLAAALTALATTELLTSVGALFFLLCVLPDGDRLHFVAAPLLYIASPRLVAKPVRWLGAWLVVGVLASSYSPAMGPAFVLGTVPIAIWQTVRSWRAERGKLGVLTALVFAAGAIVFFVPLLHQISFGFVRFILDNQWTNQTANGVALSQGKWQRDLTTGFGSTQFLWELLRFGWILVALGSAAVFWMLWSVPRDRRNLSAMVLSAAIPPVLLWSSFWISERIEPGTAGKNGVFTEVVLFLLVPPLIILLLSPRRMAIGCVALAACIGLLLPTGWLARVDLEALLNKPVAFRPVSAYTSIVDGAALGLPRIGQVIHRDPDPTLDIQAMKKCLSTWLKPGETYLDLSNSGAIQFYLDMRAPVQYPGYVAGNARMQAEMMQQLQQHPVPVVSIAPTPWLDGTPPSLRTYRPYHDYVLKFAAVSQGKFIFLVDPARAPDAGPIGSEPQLQLLDVVYRRQNLLRLPIAWGDSWKSMADRFDVVATVAQPRQLVVSPGQSGPQSWPLPAEASSGRQTDFLLMHLNFVPVNAGFYRQAQATETDPTDRSAEPHLLLRWTDAQGAISAPIEFTAQDGEVLVPLGAYPRWLLGEKIQSISLTMQNPHVARSLTVSKLTFLRLKPL